METLLQDISYGLRMLRKNAGLTAVVVLTLGIGIAANTALFSIVDAVLLRPLPFPQADQLVAIKDEVPGAKLTDAGMSEPEMDDLQNRSGVFDQISAVWPINGNVTGREKPERVEALAVSPNYFTLLGVKAEVGRAFVPGDYQPGFSEGAVISDSLWHKMFGGDPSALGQGIRVDGDLYTVIGVMPPQFRHPGRTLQQNVEVWVAAGYIAAPFPKPPIRALRMFPGAIARLKPGLTIEQAQAKLNTFTAHLSLEYPNDYPAAARWSTHLVPLQQEVVGNTGLMLILLLAAVGAVLMIACVNIASLLLARSSARHSEIAIRQALGANAWRLVRQTLTESIVLALCGGVFAVLLSLALKSILLQFVPANLPRLSEVTLDWRALVFAFGVSLLTGLLFGLAPAVQMADPRLMDNLRQGTRGVGMAVRQHRFLSALVISEFALSLVLIFGAGLLLRSFWNVLKVDPGLNPSHMVLARVWLPVPNDPSTDPYASVEKRAAFIREVLRRVSALPGVDQVAEGSGKTPFVRGRNTLPFKIESREQTGGDTPSSELTTITPDFFATVGTPLIRGRFFTDADKENSAPVAVVDQTAAELYWPNQDPINQRITFNIAPPKGGPVTFAIVGVVGRTRSDGLDAPYVARVYLPAMQFPGKALDFYIRTTATAESLKEPVRQLVQSVDPTLPVFGVRTLDSIVSDSLAQRRFTMQVLGIFAVTALLLAAIGIYGVMAYFVSQRVREIGIRMALGALPQDVLKAVVSQGMMLALAGVAGGVLLSLVMARLIKSLLFGVSAYDPVTFIALTALLTFVAFLANFIPAQRAAKVDPMVALRYE